MGINNQEELEAKYGSVEEGLAHEEGPRTWNDVVRSNEPLNWKRGLGEGNAITRETLGLPPEKKEDNKS